MATKTAAAGKFQSHGEDFVQYVDARGAEKARIDGDGVVTATDIVTSSGVSLNALKAEVEAVSITSLPSVIDLGTF